MLAREPLHRTAAALLALLSIWWIVFARSPAWHRSGGVFSNGIGYFASE